MAPFTYGFLVIYFGMMLCGFMASAFSESGFTAKIRSSYDQGSETGEKTMMRHGHQQQAMALTAEGDFRLVPSGSLKESEQEELTEYGVTEGELQPTECRKSEKAPSPEQQCPESCPFYAEDPNAACNFACVSSEQCGTNWTKQGEILYDVPDQVQKICRKCKVDGCKRCANNHLDKCGECHFGFTLNDDGTCFSNYFYVWCVILGGGGGMFLFGMLWFLDLLCCRRASNQDIFEKAVEQRQQLKLRDESQADRPAFSFFTDVHNEVNFGGIGMCIHMDFLRWCVVWAAIMSIGWWAFMKKYPEAKMLGTGSHKDYRESCYHIAQGRIARDELMADKTIYIGCCYVFTTLFCWSLSFIQRKKYNRLDAETATLRDFTLLCSDFPAEQSETVEKDVLDFIKEASGQEVVGVSVCWDTVKFSGQIEKLIEEESADRELAPGTKDLAPPPAEAPTGFFAKFERKMGFDGFLGVAYDDEAQTPAEEGTAEQKLEPEELLKSVPSSGYVYAVFRTEKARDEAADKIQSSDCKKYKNAHQIKVFDASTEPASVIWENYSQSHPYFVQRVLKGMAYIFGALIGWCVAIYVPYAYFMYTNFASGTVPGFLNSLVFTIIVILGNQIMYLICGMVAENMRLHTVDKQEAVYVMAYTAATLLNMVLDVGVVALTTYLGMCFANIRTAEGKLLRDLDTLEEILESFPLQKFLGEQMKIYNVHGCYLIPFFAEPFAALGMPYLLGKLLVRTRSVPFKKAVEVLMPIPIDLGRYADNVMNMTLLCCTFPLSAGWIQYSMFGLLVSFAYIYVLDRWRSGAIMLNFCYSTDIVDAAVARTLSIPCAVLCGATIFQMRMMRLFGLPAGWTITVVVAAFMAHLILHNVVLEVLFCYIGRPEQGGDVNYEDIAKTMPHDWFNANKIHCLREKYVLKVSNPTKFFVTGQVPQKEKTA